jgi:hypothetical protein
MPGPAVRRVEGVTIARGGVDQDGVRPMRAVRAYLELSYTANYSSSLAESASRFSSHLPPQPALKRPGALRLSFTSRRGWPLRSARLFHSGRQRGTSIHA